MLPNFLIVGAAKSGTSSLDYYLGQHPEVYIPPKKEAHHFSIPDFPKTFKGPGDEGMNLYTIRSREEYERLFDKVKTEKAVGESSVFYLYYPETAKRIQQEIPEAKIIMVLRNPVDRAFSAYMHLVRDEREDLSFEESLEKEEARKVMDFEPMWLYRDLGLYYAQVKRYLDIFGASRVKVIVFEEFVTRPQAAMQEVFRFLGVDSEFLVDTSIKLNESGKVKSRWLYNFISKPNMVKEVIKPLFPAAARERLGIKAKSLVLEKASMSPQVRAILGESFEKDIEKLESLLHRDLSVWKNKNRSERIESAAGN